MRLRAAALLTLVALFGLPPAAAAADESDPANDAALAKTQALLRDPAQREAAAKHDPAAREADAKARATGNSEADTQALYELSADVLATLTELSGGDAEKMMKILEEAKSHPEKFAESFTPAQREKLAQLARQIEESGAKKSGAK